MHYKMWRRRCGVYSFQKCHCKNVLVVHFWNDIFGMSIRHIFYSFQKWMSPVMYDQVTSHVKESCLTWTIHVTCGFVMSRMNADEQRQRIRRNSVAIFWTVCFSTLNESCHTWTNHCQTWMHLMRWLRSVGSWKSYVSFAEYSLFYTALLEKRPIILRSLLSSAKA